MGQQDNHLDTCLQGSRLEGNKGSQHHAWIAWVQGLRRWTLNLLWTSRGIWGLPRWPPAASRPVFTESVDPSSPSSRDRPKVPSRQLEITDQAHMCPLGSRTLSLNDDSRSLGTGGRREGERDLQGSAGPCCSLLPWPLDQPSPHSCLCDIQRPVSSSTGDPLESAWGLLRGRQLEQRGPDLPPGDAQPHRLCGPPTRKGQGTGERRPGQQRWGLGPGATPGTGVWSLCESW